MARQLLRVQYEAEIAGTGYGSKPKRGGICQSVISQGEAHPLRPMVMAGKKGDLGMLAHLSERNFSSFRDSLPIHEGSPRLRTKRLCDPLNEQWQDFQGNQAPVSQAILSLTRGADQIERKLAEIEREIVVIEMRLKRLCESPTRL